MAGGQSSTGSASCPGSSPALLLVSAPRRYDWPGNVRELQNVIDRALVLAPGPTLRLVEAFGSGCSGPVPHARRPADSLRDTGRTQIVGVLERCQWMIEGGKAAERLGLHPSTLRNRVNKLGIRRLSGR